MLRLCRKAGKLTNALFYVQISVHKGRRLVKTIQFTDFRKRASSFITEVEHGEILVLLRRGRPVAEIIPFSNGSHHTSSWKQPLNRLRIRGSDISSAILDEREATEGVRIRH